MDANELPALIDGLRRPAAYPHPVASVDHIETHISHLLLAGDYAYKLKKPLDLGFLDFSTLERRHRFCQEELRLNRRLTKDLYLEVVAVTGSREAPRIQGEGPILEYAVKMRRFPEDALLARQVLTGELMDRLAALVADFHASAPTVDLGSRLGTPEAVLAPMIESLDAIRVQAIFPESRARLDRLEDWTRERHRRLTPLIERRRTQGFVRECHGDMHRGNIALVQGEIQIFDAIEFNPTLRWIDTASELAFLVMDLEQAGQVGMARRLLNRYLELSGDYESLALLDFYKVYRAVVRSKVLAIRLGQGDLGADEEAEQRRECSRYLELAETYARPRCGHLLIACGLPGSGKSRISGQLREALPFIHLRSDVERKRLFGLPETAHTTSGVDAGIYFPSATEWTYERLLRLADSILGSGYDVLVDATFIARARRRRFLALARRHRAAFAILALDAPLEVLRERVSTRQARQQDASEANIAVLERQHAGRQCLDEKERSHAILIDTSLEVAFSEVLSRVRRVLGMAASEAGDRVVPMCSGGRRQGGESGLRAES